MPGLLPKNRVKELWSQGKPAFGTFSWLGRPAAVEILGHAGFDFVIFDMEHGPLDAETVENLIRAAGLAGAVPLVRVTANSAALILRALDAGAMGVHVPQVQNAGEAAAVVRAVRYPGAGGTRGLAFSVRAAGYGAAGREAYLKWAAEEVLAIVAVETVEAVANLDAILAVPGIDAVFVGPTDLSTSMGFPGEVDRPDVDRALAGVVERIARAGIPAGILARTAEEAEKWVRRGATYVPLVSDGAMLLRAARELAAGAKARAGRV